MSEISLKKEYFREMKYPIFEMDKDIELVVEFDELALYKELALEDISVTEKQFNEEIDADEMVEIGRLEGNYALRYTMFMYDIKTPLTRITNLRKRKEVAATLAGWKMVGKKFKNPMVEMMLRNEIPQVLDMITCWFSLQNHRDFELKVTGEEAFSMMLTKVRQPIQGMSDDRELKAYEIKTKCYNDSFAISQKIEELDRKMFSNDEELEEIVTGHKKSKFKPGAAEKYAE